MDRDSIEQVRASNEACIELVTLLSANRDAEAADLVLTNPIYRHPATAMAIATLTVSAVRTLGELVDADPLEIVQVAALSAANLTIQLENDENEEG